MVGVTILMTRTLLYVDTNRTHVLSPGPHTKCQVIPFLKELEMPQIEPLCPISGTHPDIFGGRGEGGGGGGGGGVILMLLSGLAIA